jgi:Hemolysins and related proteins containing CBS domains
MYLLAIAFFFAMSSFFSMVKIIFVSIDKITPLDEESTLTRTITHIKELQENKNLFAATVSLGKSFANIAFSIISFRILLLYLPFSQPYQLVIVAFAFSLIVLSVGGHFIARAFAICFYRKFIIAAYLIYRGFSWLLLPLVSVSIGLHKLLLKTVNYDDKFSFLTEREKLKLAESSESDETALDEEEKEMIHSIFRLGDLTVDQIMVPRINITGLDSTSDFETTLDAIRTEGHSRFPVFKETIDSIVGILYAKEVLSWISQNSPQTWDLNSIIKKPHFVPMSKKVDGLMREFKKDHIHIAVVVDEYGGTAGIVTMEDILEEIVGEIHDEYDLEEKPIVQIAKNLYRIDPHIDLTDLSEKFNIILAPEDADYTTLSGLIYHECGTIPSENTEFEFNGVRIKVLKMDNQRIEKVQIEILPKPVSPSESAEK